MAKVDVKIDDHTREALLKLRHQIQIGFAGIGQEAEGFAKKNCPVDSGRLRNSIAWACTDKHGSKSYSGGNKVSKLRNPVKPDDDQPQGIPEENAVYIGTNVEYAVYVEYGDYKHKVGEKHFLRNAIANNGERFREIMQAALDAM